MTRLLTVLAAVCGLVLIGAADQANAQSSPLSCANQLANMNLFPDSIRVLPATGRPGDTINVQIGMRNTKKAAAWALYLDVDTTWLKPILNQYDPIEDAYEYKILPTGRVDTTALDRFTANNEKDYPSIADHLRLKILGLPKSTGIRAAIDSGRGSIISMPMVITEGMPHNTQTSLTWYYADIVDPINPTIIYGCQYSNYTNDTGTYTGKLATISGAVRVDTAAVQGPVINSFAANPTSLPSGGGSTTLSWTVTNADTIYISPGNITRSGSAALSGSVLVGLSSTTTYTLTAAKIASSQRPTAQATVTVEGTVSNNNPVVSPISPSSYTITQGENVSFSVTATDVDDDFITLSAQNLPANATFGTGGQVTGTGTATGNFSFTPNTTQEGTFVVGFRATDDRGGASTVVNVSITVEKIQFDILFSKSREGGSPVGGLPGKRSILFPIDLVTSQDVYGVQFDFFYDDMFFEIDSIFTTTRTEGWVIYDNIGQPGTPAGEIRIMTFGMETNPLAIDSTNSTTILFIAMSIDSSATWGDYPIYLENGWESNNPDPAYPSLQLVTDSAIIQVDRRGDVNLDKRIDVADAVNIVAAILGNITLVERQFDVADIVIDGTVDVFDLVGVINTAFGLPVEQPQPVAPSGGELFATVSLEYHDMFAGSIDELVVSSELPEEIAGVQLNITYDPAAVVLGQPKAADDASGLKLLYKNTGPGEMLVLMHFTRPGDQQQLIQRGLADLVQIPITAQNDVEYGNPAQLKLTSVKLATPTAKALEVKGFGPTLPAAFTLYQNYPNPFNPMTTIRFELSGTSRRVQLDVFNVLGQQVRRLLDETVAPGEHSVVWDATTDNGSKVATGVYLYRLQVGDQSDTKKMLLLK